MVEWSNDTLSPLHSVPFTDYHSDGRPDRRAVPGTAGGPPSCTSNTVGVSCGVTTDRSHTTTLHTGVDWGGENTGPRLFHSPPPPSSSRTLPSLHRRVYGDSVPLHTHCWVTSAWKTTPCLRKGSRPTPPVPASTHPLTCLKEQ